MECQKEDCRGTINIDSKSTILKLNSERINVYPCSVCGRLHFRNGVSVIKKGKKLFLKGNKLVAKKQRRVTPFELIENEPYKIDKIRNSGSNGRFAGKKLSGVEVQVTNIHKEKSSKKGYASCKIFFREDVIVDSNGTTWECKKGQSLHFLDIKFKQA